MNLPDDRQAEARTREPGFLGALIGDGRPLIVLTALALAGAGGFALFLSASGAFLPHDVAFLGMAPEVLCGINECRIVHFMIHDRFAFGGVLISIATLYAWIALFPLRHQERWSWDLLLLTGSVGFGSFLAYLGYGYLDTWHGWATLLLLPVFVAGMTLTKPAAHTSSNPLLKPGAASMEDRWSRTKTGWWSLVLTGMGMVAAGATILAVGMTVVFVPEDVRYIGLTSRQLNEINPKLIPLIAHDRAGFGGGLFTTGLLVTGIVWKATPSRHVWEALALAGGCGFGCAIGVHYPIGYVDWFHLAPAWAGLLLFLIGMGLVRPHYLEGPRNIVS